MLEEEQMYSLNKKTYMGQAHETGTNGHLTCLLLGKALKML